MDFTRDTRTGCKGGVTGGRSRRAKAQVVRPVRSQVQVEMAPRPEVQTSAAQADPPADEKGRSGNPQMRGLVGVRIVWTQIMKCATPLFPQSLGTLERNECSAELLSRFMPNSPPYRWAGCLLGDGHIQYSYDSPVGLLLVWDYPNAKVNDAHIRGARRASERSLEHNHVSL